MTRVLLADDHRIVTESLRMLLQSSGFDVVAAVSTADEIRAVFDGPADQQPTAVLCDLDMPGVGMAGVSPLADFLRSHGARLAVLSAFFAPHTVEQVLAAGAHGFIRKTALPDEIAQMLRAVCAGQVDVMDTVTASRVSEARRSTPTLTGREVDVLALLSEGMTNADIASRLFIGRQTVKSHVDSLRNKLKVSTRTAIARRAWQLGLLTPADGAPAGGDVATGG